MTDPIIQTKTCQHCQSSFDITQGDMDFYDKISPTLQTSLSEGEGSRVRFKISTPTLCPNCRQRRRLSFRNERKLYKRKCDASGKDMISMYSSDKSYKVYDQTIWRSDDWNPMDYGFEFEFSQTFTENFRKLNCLVPHLNLLGLQNEGSDYVNGVFAGVKSYLCFNCDYIENCLYTQNSIKLKDSKDCLSCMNSENLYECIGCDSCYECFYSVACQDCSFCFQCENLTGKSYYINNISYTKEEYLSKIGSLKGSIISTSVNDIHNHKNKECSNILDCQNLENCSNCYYVYNSKDCMDFDIFGDNSSLIYESIAVGANCYHNLFSSCCWAESKDCYYCSEVVSCSNCFGCIGLRNQQYCIFNRQYENKEKYEEQVSKIIQHMVTTGEWGEFFHPSLSPFGYNETVAQEYYPLSNDLVIARRDDAAIQGIINQGEMDRHATLAMTIDYGNFGYTRSTYEAPTPQVDKVIRGEDLPVSITDVDDNILKVAIQCSVSGKPFRIIPQELAFYRKHNIALPRKHPDVRHLERMKLRRGT